MRKFAPPTTKFGPQTAQAKQDGGMKVHQAPPTKFGQPAVGQPKPMTLTPSPVHHAPPPTRFGAAGITAQRMAANPAAARSASACCPHHPPSPRTAASRVLQAMDYNGLDEEEWFDQQVPILGKGNHLAFGQALGNSGSTQTTDLEAKINGRFFGTFSNVQAHMKKEGLSMADYPATCVLENDPPHAEDWLLVALNQAWTNSSGRWQDFYPPRDIDEQPFNLLSIKTDKTACPVCARNLIRFCVATGLKLREKASTFYDDDDKAGAEILGLAGVPVRHWSYDQVSEYSQSYSSKPPSDMMIENPKGGFLKFKGINEKDMPKFKHTGRWGDLGWSRVNFGENLIKQNIQLKRR